MDHEITVILNRVLVAETHDGIVAVERSIQQLQVLDFWFTPAIRLQQSIPSFTALAYVLIIGTPTRF